MVTKKIQAYLTGWGLEKYQARWELKHLDLETLLVLLAYYLIGLKLISGKGVFSF